MMSRVLIAAMLVGMASVSAAEPLTLDEALAQANRANPDVRGARITQDEAGIDVSLSYANVLPQLNLGAQFTHFIIGAQTRVATVPSKISVDPNTGDLNLQFEQQAIPTPAFDYPDYQIGLTLTQPLFDGFKSWNTISKYNALERSARRATDETWLTVAFETTRRFYEAVRAERTLAVLDETAKRSEDVLMKARALFTAGRGPKSDVVAAEVNLGSDRVNVEQQRGKLDQSKADLAFEIGWRPEEVTEVAAPRGLDGASAAAEEVPSLDSLVDQARAVNPTIQKYRAQVDSAGMDSRIADSTWYPQVGVQLSYSREGPNVVGGDAVYGNPGRQYVGMGQIYLNWNLFQGFSTRNTQRRAALALELSREQAVQAERQVVDGISRARIQALAVQRTLSITEQSLAAAEEGVRLARDRYDVGLGTQLEIRDAVQKLSTAKQAVLNARIDYAIARADLKRAVGAL